jgi:NADH:ubiquinone reductase (H+-translocating)
VEHLKNMSKHRVVIIGGGFGGLNAAKSLKHADVEVTLIDRRNFHLFQPLLYQVATGALSPAEIAFPLRVIFRRQRNTTVLLGEVTDLDVNARTVILNNGESVPYDTLIVAAGTTDNYFNRPDWHEFAPGLKSVENATEIRRRVLLAFESAEREADPVKRKQWMTFVIIGGGATGVEMSGAISEIANDTLHKDFRRIHTADSEVILVEGGARLLVAYPEDLSESAEKQLLKLKVHTKRHSLVTAIDADGVEMKSGDVVERIHAKTIIWAAGVKASPLGKLIAERTGATADKMGRVIVEPDCTVKGRPEILVIGDLANFSHQEGGQPLPGVAQTGIQMGQYAAKLIKYRLRNLPCKPFHYWDKGNMATIGRAAAVAQIGKLHVSGLLAWMMWLTIHLMYLVGFQNRLVVLLQWFYSYATFNRGARLITGNKDQLTPVT